MGYFRLFILIVFLVSCERPVEVDFGQNKLIEVTDTRDGEVWRYNTNTVKDVHQGFGSPDRMTVTDTKGQVRELNSDMNVYLKWKEIGK